MGSWVEFDLEIRIKKDNIEKALKILNHLHSDDMLTQYASICQYNKSHEIPTQIRRKYGNVKNPKKPYQSLKEAFRNWDMVDDETEVIQIDERTGDFKLTGSWDRKIGLQGFLLRHLAPVLEDTTVLVLGEPRLVWIIKNYQFKELPRPLHKLHH